MDTIRNYIENIFANLPKTPDILKIKEEVLLDMEASYKDLIEAGSEEYEAIGQVISQFGNIDEIIEEMNVEEKPNNDTPVISMEQVKSFIDVARFTAKLVGAGVVIVLLAIIMLIGTSTLIENIANPLPIGLFFLMVIPAVGLFIYAGHKNSPFKFIEDGEFQMGSSVEEAVRRRQRQSKSKGPASIIVGVTLCILGITSLMLLSGIGKSTEGIMVMLFLIAIAVFLFINSQVAHMAYEKLLKEGEYAPKSKEKEKLIGAIAAFYWPILVAAFLAWGFLLDGWTISWVLFPIGGLVFAAISGFISNIKK